MTPIDQRPAADFPETVFEGPAEPMPAAIARGRVQYTSKKPSRSQIRHVDGYAPFLKFRADNNIEIDQSDFRSLLDVLRRYAGPISADPSLRAATTRYVGNVLVTMREDAVWRAFEGQSATAGNRHRSFDVEFLIDRIGQADDTWVAGYLEIVQNWAKS